jgi:hypothetical protein
MSQRRLMNRLTLAFFSPSLGAGPPNLPILIPLVHLPVMPGPSHPNGSLSQKPSSPPSQNTYLGRPLLITSANGSAPECRAKGREGAEGERRLRDGGGVWRRRRSRPVGLGAVRAEKEGWAGLGPELEGKR